MKVSLEASWLQENGMLREALPLLGHALVPNSYTALGVDVLDREGKMFHLAWEGVSLTFTIAELIKLGFELGDLEYCPGCKKLLADCKREVRCSGSTT